MSFSAAGVRACASSYIRSRQVQNVSGPGPARSVRPARARWNAWLWRFGTPGIRSAHPLARRAAGRSGAHVGNTAVGADADLDVGCPAVGQQCAVCVQGLHGGC